MVCLASSALRVGEPDLRCGIVLTIACNAAKFSKSQALPREGSSSLELWEDSGGEMVAPVGINNWFTGGGDCRRLPWGSTFFLFFLSSSPTVAVRPRFMAGDWVVSSFFDMDGLRRCLERYEDDSGRSGLAGAKV